MQPTPVPTTEPPARERIVQAAYELFTRRGVRAVGIDEVIAASGVAKATLYRHFRSKDELVLEVLLRREEAWTTGLVAAGARERADGGQDRLLAVFDVLDEWFRAPDFEACPFLTVLLEMGPDHPLGAASVAHLANIRVVLHEFAAQAGVLDPDGLVRSWHLLMKGAILSAVEGDREAARRAKGMARSLIEQHRAEPGPGGPGVAPALLPR